MYSGKFVSKWQNNLRHIITFLRRKGLFYGVEVPCSHKLFGIFRSFSGEGVNIIHYVYYGLLGKCLWLKLLKAAPYHWV